MVMGEGQNPSIDHLIELGNEAKLPRARIHEIIEQTQTALSRWKNLAKEYGVAAHNIELIDAKLIANSPKINTNLKQYLHRFMIGVTPIIDRSFTAAITASFVTSSTRFLS